MSWMSAGTGESAGGAGGGWSVLTGQQFQSETVEPVYILLEDFTHVKFYRYSLRAGIEDQGGRFDGFQHVADWVPQHLVTATGPNPLPR